MNNGTILSWLSEFALRTLSVICVGFLLMNSWSIVKAYQSSAQNHLLPESLGHYNAFPYYFFIAFYCWILFVIWKFLRRDYDLKYMWLPVLGVFLFKTFKFFVYGFLMWLNPFG